MEEKESLDNNQQETMKDDKSSNEEEIDYTLPENHTVEQIVQHRKALQTSWIEGMIIGAMDGIWLLHT
jgi:hypothetical protein